MSDERNAKIGPGLDPLNVFFVENEVDSAAWLAEGGLKSLHLRYSRATASGRRGEKNNLAGYGGLSGAFR